MMLAVIHYKKKNHDAMRQTLSDIERKAKKSGLYWSVRAYLLNQIGEREAAQQVLAKGVEKAPEDPKLKITFRLCKTEEDEDEVVQHAVSTHLEKPPMVMQQNPMQLRMSKARRGR